MAKKEFKVGEIFKFGLMTLKVEKEKGELSCCKCIFNHTYLCGNINEFTGSCFSDEREDKQSVIFVRIND